MNILQPKYSIKLLFVQAEPDYFISLAITCTNDKPGVVTAPDEFRQILWSSTAVNVKH